MTQITIDNVINTYKFYAPLYDYIFGSVFEPGRHALANVVKEQAPSSILEIGVGTGLMLEYYPVKTKIVGVDISSDMLDIAKDRADDLPEHKIKLMKVDAEALNFADGSFDCVTLPYVLSVTPNPEKLVSELRRVCRKGGTIIILNHFSGSRFWTYLERTVRAMANRIGFRSDFDYAEQILKHNWEILSVKTVNVLGLSKLVVIRNI